jgi:hypothetical protein
MDLFGRAKRAGAQQDRVYRIGSPKIEWGPATSLLACHAYFNTMFQVTSSALCHEVSVTHSNARSCTLSLLNVTWYSNQATKLYLPTMRSQAYLSVTPYLRACQAQSYRHASHLCGYLFSNPSNTRPVSPWPTWAKRKPPSKVVPGLRSQSK